jgi:hypothetical protein
MRRAAVKKLMVDVVTLHPHQNPRGKKNWTIVDCVEAPA